MIFQDPHVGLHPCTASGGCRSSRRSCCTMTCRRRPRGCAASSCSARRHPARRAPHRRLPAPVLRRHAAARDDRDGADQRPDPAHRRRADDGPRRDDAGADPEPDRAPPVGVPQRGDHDHARPRRRRRDRRRRRRHVRREHRRAGAVDEIFKRPHHPYTWGLSAGCRGATRTSSGSCRSRASRRRC